MSARVIRVDWEAWAACEARARAVCGARAFLLGPSHAALARVARSEWELAREPCRVLPVLALAPGPSGHLPGIAEWLEAGR
jgi:hypothetical protein